MTPQPAPEPHVHAFGVYTLHPLSAYRDPYGRWLHASRESANGCRLPDNYAARVGETVSCEACGLVFVAEPFPRVERGQQGVGVLFRRETRGERRRRIKAAPVPVTPKGDTT